MAYISLNYYLFIVIVLFMYYIFPLSKRWIILLTGNIIFYMMFYKTGWWILFLTTVISYIAGLAISKTQGRVKNSIFIMGLVAVILPWFLIKNCRLGVIVPLGISFYTVQIIAYIADVYKDKIFPEKNIAKYMLFISFFPQIIQGPIPRYNQLRNQLVEGHLFDENKFIKGGGYLIWGFFLKFMIADKAAVIVNDVFDNYSVYSALYIWIASFLYSIQLYTDFLACTTLAQGVSMLFGIELADNFACPYFATSIKDFWRRWHISFSTWLKDYIYIPLGGNRKGKARRIINLIVTFLISGLWHGAGVKFLIWGLIHALYQIVGDVTYNVREAFYIRLEINSHIKKKIKRIGTFLLVNWAWIIFRADNLHTGINMTVRMFGNFSQWFYINDRVFANGFAKKEIIVLFLSICILWCVGKAHEKKISISSKIMSLNLTVRWGVYMFSILTIIVFGTYGYGFNAQDFIYGGF